MHVLHVIVKGTKEQATRAAADRGVPVALVKMRKMRRIGSIPETVLVVGDQYIDKVARWFAEPGEAKTGYGYPPGTVLFYNEQHASSSKRGRFGS